MEERQMANARKRARQRRRAKSLIGSMREFLTPEVFKQVRNASKRRKSPRWDLHPLLYILLLTTYCCGDSLPEKFEAARGFYVVCCPKRKRPGASFAGFEKAIAKLPMPVLRALAAAIRGRVEAIFGDRWKVGNFIPFGCDGTRQTCPRTEELERRLGTFGKEGSSPMIWNTSIVHLTLGFPFCWRLGKGGKASERSHLISMLRWLPAAALIVADAGYVGYEVVATMIAANVFFLIRMSSNATFYSEANEPLDEFREGIVYYWPKTQQSEGKPPIRGRLMRIHSGRHKVDVWLFTNVEDPTAVVLGNGGHLLSLEVGKRGIFQNLQADAEEGHADEPDGATGASRGGSFDDRHAIAAVPRRVGDACAAEGQPSGDVQSARRVAGSASRHRGTQEARRAVWRTDCPGATRTACAHQRETKTRMAASQATYAAPSARFAEADRRTEDQ